MCVYYNMEQRSANKYWLIDVYATWAVRTFHLGCIKMYIIHTSMRPFHDLSFRTRIRRYTIQYKFILCLTTDVDIVIRTISDKCVCLYAYYNTLYILYSAVQVYGTRCNGKTKCTLDCTGCNFKLFARNEYTFLQYRNQKYPLGRGPKLYYNR